MKFDYIERIQKEKENESKWTSMVLRPLLLGVTLGAGCYVAKVILNSPIMNSIVNSTANCAAKKLELAKL